MASSIRCSASGLPAFSARKGKPSRMFSISMMCTPPEEGGDMEAISKPRKVPRTGARIVGR